MYNFYYDDVNQYITENKQILIDEITENNTAATDENIYQLAAERINDINIMLNSCLREYDAKHDNKIIVVASLGLWYGRREATKIFNNLYDAFYSCVYDVNYLYFKNINSTMNLKSAHHDGVNYYKFYKLVNGKKYAIKLNDLLACY